MRVDQLVTFCPGHARRIFRDMAEGARTEQASEADKDLSQLIESVRSMVAEQFQIAERLDRKARYQVGTSGAFFAVVQAAAINAITSADLSTGWIVALAAFGLSAGFMTIASLISASDAWRTQTEKDLPIPDLRQMVDNIVLGRDEPRRELAHHYINLAERRKAGNVERIKRVKRAAGAATVSIGLTGLELIMVFIALAHHG